MTPATVTERGSEQTTDKTAIRPFQVNVPEAELRNCAGASTRQSGRTGNRHRCTQGTQLATSQKLARYWVNDYDWRKVEANSRPCRIHTEIDGLDIHFVTSSKHENALPVIVTHGWPGSIVEQMKIIDPLTNPTAHGASASDASMW